MLSPGTRIGPARILDWLGEGSCGQSYHSIGTEGQIKDSEFYIKLISREVSERKGFQDYFMQEVQAIEQLEGKGIWPVQGFGVTKWKHWIRYSWIDGLESSSNYLNEGTTERKVRNLQDLCELLPNEVTPQQMLSLMVSLHRGIYKAHLAGVCHGNLKPTNILVQKNAQGEWVSAVTEFGLYRLNLFTPLGLSKEDREDISIQNLDGRDSFIEGDKFRPKGIEYNQVPDESWDLFAMGKLVTWLIDQVNANSKSISSWEDWQKWSFRAVGKNGVKGFESCAHSMEALPNVGDISCFGVKVVEVKGFSVQEIEDLRLKKERKFKLDEQAGSLKTKRGITGLVGGLSFAFFLLYSAYLFFAPTPWTEYSLKGALDSYQLGVGLWSGQAWGIVPGIYDEDGDGGQDVVGEWKRENGLLKLKFKRFKKSLEEKSGKKLWQFIGKGGTSANDYFIWYDYLEYNNDSDSLRLIKREDNNHVYIPAVGKDGMTRLYPEERIKFGGGKIKKSKIVFDKDSQSEISWSLFFAIGFSLASLLYNRELKRLAESNNLKN
jgi:hypothetical protein